MGSAILFSAIFIIWLTPLVRAGALTSAIMTFLSGFVAFGFLVKRNIPYAIGIGAVFLFGGIVLIRKLDSWSRSQTIKIG